MKDLNHSHRLGKIISVIANVSLVHFPSCSPSSISCATFLFFKLVLLIGESYDLRLEQHRSEQQWAPGDEFPLSLTYPLSSSCSNHVFRMTSSSLRFVRETESGNSDWGLDSVGWIINSYRPRDEGKAALRKRWCGKDELENERQQWTGECVRVRERCGEMNKLRLWLIFMVN